MRAALGVAAMGFVMTLLLAQHGDPWHDRRCRRPQDR